MMKSPEPKKALVTGGAGFIGSNVVGELLKNSYQVVVLDDFSTGHKENLKLFSGVKILQGDIRDEKILEQALDKVDVVFDLAASVGNVKSLEDPSFDSDVNVLGTLNILAQARKRGVRKIVYSSSAAVYGEPHYLPIDEKHPINPDSFYGVSKLAGELHCLCFSKIYDMDIIALRYFNVYGRNQRYDVYGNVIPIFTTLLSKKGFFTIYGDGEQTRDFVNVDDVVQANLLAAEAQGVRGVFNVGSGQSLTVNELSRIIQDLSGISVKVNYVPSRKGEVKHSSADISAAKELLGYKPKVSIADGLKDYIEWIRGANL